MPIRVHLAMGAFYISVIPMTLSLIFAPVVFLWSAFVFLKDGYWIGSPCRLAGDMVFRGANPGLANICGDVTTSWLGFNTIAEWALRDVDTTLLLIMIHISGWILTLGWGAIALRLIPSRD